MGKECVLPAVCDHSHPCDLAREVSKVTEPGLSNFSYPTLTFLNPIYTSGWLKYLFILKAFPDFPPPTGINEPGSPA